MDFFENSFRTIGTRGIVLTEEDMQLYRIKRIHNSVTAIDYADISDPADLLADAVLRGEYCLVEASCDEKVYKTSLILFEDIWSRNLFALRNWNYYEGFSDLLTFYN
jgi:hypothetical protein